jgi:N-acetylglucosaminyldiphosphoundecaprenol N-acetyl-beta-D-mannosaminyltransferase
VAKKIQIIGLETNVCDHESAVETIAALDGGYVCVATVHMVMEAHDDPEFAAKVNAADLVVPDGMPLVWMQKLQGAREASRVRGNDLTLNLCRYTEDAALQVGFYGGRQEVLEAIKVRAARDFPKLNIAYAYAPPFRELTAAEDAEVVAGINEAAPDILFVGLGCPKQENWMAAHRDSVKAVMVGVGAAFDFYAGNLREAPKWLSNIGLEWLFRLAMEPRRLWKRYLVLNPQFMWLAAKQLMRKELFHDTVLAKNVSFTVEWRKIDVRGSIKVERDRQLVTIELREPFQMPLEEFEIRDAEGRPVNAEIRLVSEDGKIYCTSIASARGNYLIGYAPDEALPKGTVFERLEIRSDAPFEAGIWWTTYDYRDRK